MAIEFTVLDKPRAVRIDIAGDIAGEDMSNMRRRSVEIVNETGYTNFIVDIRKLTSIAQGQTSSLYDLGESFAEAGFTVWSHTAVLMPVDAKVRRDVELMHIVEINRGRGIMTYVETVDEALSWFKDAPHHVRPD